MIGNLVVVPDRNFGGGEFRAGTSTWNFTVAENTFTVNSGGDVRLNAASSENTNEAGGDIKLQGGDGRGTAFEDSTLCEYPHDFCSPSTK